MPVRQVLQTKSLCQLQGLRDAREHPGRLKHPHNTSQSHSSAPLPTCGVTCSCSCCGCCGASLLGSEMGTSTASVTQTAHAGRCCARVTWTLTLTLTGPLQET
jgi:hypothetical protein